MSALPRTAEQRTRQDASAASNATGKASSSQSTGTSRSASPRVVLPTVNIPVLTPGYPLALNTAALENSTAHYFRPGQGPHGKRSRSATELSATSSSISVLDTLSFEERAYPHHTGERDGSSDAHSAAKSATSADAPARTKKYLTTLFQDPVRREHDVYRPVDVALCRRLLRDDEDAVRKAGNASCASADVVKQVCAFRSCLTIGQHRRYRPFVLEWLRHQPSRAAPPDSGEVLKVVQEEQRLFLEVLRREAVAGVSATGRPSASSSASSTVSLYEFLSPALVDFAKYRRTAQMRRQLMSFLHHARQHQSDEVLLTICAPPQASTDTAESGSGDATVADFSGVAFEQEGGRDGEAKAAPQPRTLTPQQLFQRRYPSLRVLQWHMVKLYNAQQTGMAAPFPSPQVQSVVEQPNGTGAESDSTAASPVASPQHHTVPGLPRSTTPSLLRMRELPHTASRDNSDASNVHSDGDDGEATSIQHNAESDADGEDGDSAEESPFSSSSALSSATTSMSVAAVRHYVEQHLLPRFGWRASKYGGAAETTSLQGPQPQQPQQQHPTVDAIESVSLAVTFPALLKLFVAHVDTEEPRTSFRVPLRVQLTPMAKANHSASDVANAGLRYHAHVVVGDAVPNVKESRQSVQVAAAQHLIRQACLSDGADGGIHAKEDQHTAEAGATKAQPHLPLSSVLSQVVLTRSATMQNTVEKGQAAVQAAGGDRIKASAEVFLTMKEAVADVAPPLTFRVAAQSDLPAPASQRPTFILAKMEHLNSTSAGTVVPPTATAVPLATGPTETAGRCPYLLESLAPREMLQLDLLFACYPDAVVQVHRVQYTPGEATSNGTAASADGDGETSRPFTTDDAMQVLAVETLTCVSWAALRQQLQHRPAESLITSPTPSEVLATHSWDLLYDTLAWLLDSVERHAVDALRTCANHPAKETSPTQPNSDLFLYFILSNHANLVNTSASTKLYAKKPRHADEPAENVASTFTESRFAVRYVLQDASELYPDYEPRIDIAFEAENLTFLEAAQSGSGDDDDHDRDTDEKGVSVVASRLFRDPHTWNADTIPFTFPRATVIMKDTPSTPAPSSSSSQ